MTLNIRPVPCVGYSYGLSLCWCARVSLQCVCVYISEEQSKDHCRSTVSSVGNHFFSTPPPLWRRRLSSLGKGVAGARKNRTDRISHKFPPIFTEFHIDFWNHLPQTATDALGPLKLSGLATTKFPHPSLERRLWRKFSQSISRADNAPKAESTFLSQQFYSRTENSN